MEQQLKDKVIFVRAGDTLHARAAAQAKRDNASIAELGRRALEFYLDHPEIRHQQEVFCRTA